MAVLGLLAGTAGQARAGQMTSYTGNTQPYDSDGGQFDVGATIDFAVYDRAGGTASDPFGTGLADFDARFNAATGSGPSLDTTASYLYLYQTVNNGPDSGSNPIFDNTVFINPTLVTSAGSFSNTSFDSAVVGAPAGFADPSGASTGYSTSVVSGSGDLTTPFVVVGSSSLQAYYFSELPGGQKSVLWGYTSNTGPGFNSTAIINVTGANGSAPTATPTFATPEPSAVAFAISALPVGLIAWLRRRKRTEVSA